jgi:hypothetical protein
MKKMLAYVGLMFLVVAAARAATGHTVAAQNQLNFSNTAFQRQMSALQGLSGLFGVDSNLLTRTLGIPAELLNVRSNASKGGNGFARAAHLR